MKPSESSNLKRTPLYDLHLELGAKMVPFAGYEMPVQYPAGVLKEHLHCRNRAGLFDVSHMGQILVAGPQAVAGLEKLIPIDVAALADNRLSYGVFTNPQGGILDDLIVTRWSTDQFFLVVNAACKELDFTHLQTQLPDCRIEMLGDRALLAFQGPEARTVIAELAPEAAELKFMSGCPARLDDVDCYITCSGYTGEDGFELSIPAGEAEKIARLLLSFDAVEAIGLGARDSLRLEAGLCLYGSDMDATTTPVEAGLAWSIGKSRRMGGAKQGGFLGAEIILEQMIQGIARQRVGLKIDDKAPVRQGTPLVDQNGQQVGVVCSGGYGPSFQAPIAMAYVPIEYSVPDTELFALVRDKPRLVRVAKTPFVPQRYFRS